MKTEDMKIEIILMIDVKVTAAKLGKICRRFENQLMEATTLHVNQIYARQWINRVFLQYLIATSS
jgi:CRISPR/Cas system-associated protein endoribonuclease Cas2